MCKILVKGYAGVIGSHVCELLSKDFVAISVDNFYQFYDKNVKIENIGSFINHEKFSFHEIDIIGRLAQIPKQTIDAIIRITAKTGERPSIENPEFYEIKAAL